MTVTPELFKGIAGSFPAGVAVLTTVDADGTPRGLTTTAVCSVSCTPPLLLACVDKSSQTLAALHQSRSFVLNFLREGSEHVSGIFASKSPDKFVDLPWAPAEHAGGAPILTEHVIAHAECTVQSITDAGDHDLFLAKVEFGSCSEGSPLMYFRRSYASWPRTPELRSA